MALESGTTRRRRAEYILTVTTLGHEGPKCTCMWQHLMVKQSRNSSGVAQRVPGNLGSQIFHEIRHVKVVRLSVLCIGCLYP